MNHVHVHADDTEPLPDPVRAPGGRMTEVDVDVAIVGCGPAGLFAALLPS